MTYGGSSKSGTGRAWKLPSDGGGHAPVNNTPQNTGTSVAMKSTAGKTGKAKLGPRSDGKNAPSVGKGKPLINAQGAAVKSYQQDAPFKPWAKPSGGV